MLGLTIGGQFINDKSKGFFYLVNDLASYRIFKGTDIADGNGYFIIVCQEARRCKAHAHTGRGTGGNYVTGLESNGAT